MKVIFGVAVLLCLSQARILPPKARLSFKEKLALEIQRKQVLSSEVNVEEADRATTTTSSDLQTVNEVRVVTDSTVTPQPPYVSSRVPVTSQPPHVSSTVPVTYVTSTSTVTSRPHYVDSSVFRSTTKASPSTKAPVTSTSTSSASPVVKGVHGESLFPSEGEGDLFPRTKPEFHAPGIRPAEPVVRVSPHAEEVPAASDFASTSSRERADLGSYDYEAAFVFSPHDMSSFHAESPFFDEYRTGHRPFGF